MNNFTSIIIVVVVILVVALAGVMLLMNRTGSVEGAPGGNQIVKLLLADGQLTPKQIDISSQWPVIFIVNNFSSRKHDLVIRKLNAQGKDDPEELRHFEILATQSHQERMKLEPGTYVIYCTLREGFRTHRQLGEEAKIIVH